jgi:hypothetical protein
VQVFGGLLCSGDVSESLLDKFDNLLVGIVIVPFVLLGMVSMDYVVALGQVSEASRMCLLSRTVLNVLARSTRLSHFFF